MPVGSTLGAIGLPVVTPSALGPPSALLADNIDPQTRDFASVATGADVVDAQVQLALQVVRATGGSVMDVGIDAPPPKMISLQSVLDSRVRNALKRLVSKSDVRVVRVVVAADESAQQAVVTVDYVNLRALDGAVRTAVVSAPRVL